MPLDKFIGDQDAYLFSEGTHRRLWDLLAAHSLDVDGKPGVRFAVWAPAAQRVAVVGDFNGWNTDANPMATHGTTGIWEVFVPGVEPGAKYKYAITGRDGSQQPLKADPMGFGSEHPPETA